MLESSLTKECVSIRIDKDAFLICVLKQHSDSFPFPAEGDLSMPIPVSSLIKEEYTDIHVFGREGKIAWVRPGSGGVIRIGPVATDIPEIDKLFKSDENTDIAFDFPIAGTGKPIRARVAARSSHSDRELFIRLLPTMIPDIGMTGGFLVVRKFPEPEEGLYLVSGATGSGKSTFLAGILQCYLDTSPVHVVTIEDPVEYVLYPNIGNVSQRECPSNMFHESVRLSLREDPDVILIGEIRDPETADAALTAAETGHMVFATVHAPDATGAIGRIMSLLGSGEYNALRLSQRYKCGCHLEVDREGTRKCTVMWASQAIRTSIRERLFHQLDANSQMGDQKPEVWTNAIDGMKRKSGNDFPGIPAEMRKAGVVRESTLRV